MEKRICIQCGTQNENDYIYCKNCGIKLPAPKMPEENAPIITAESVSKMPQVKATEPQDYEIAELQVKNESAFEEEHTVSNETVTEPADSKEEASVTQGNPTPMYGAAGIYSAYSINGVSADDVALFIGKKSSGIMPKFFKMEFSRSKVSWCWPTAILGFVFGPLGSAIWFFYRKMYKIGAIFAALGVALMILSASFPMGEIKNLSDEVITAYYESDSNALLEALENIDFTELIPILIISFITNIISTISLVFAGIFGFYIYKNHCTKAIKNFKSSIPDNRYYKVGLMSIGGVSSGMAAVGIILIILTSNISTFINFIASAI